MKEIIPPPTKRSSGIVRIPALKPLEKKLRRRIGIRNVIIPVLILVFGFGAGAWIALMLEQLSEKVIPNIPLPATVKGSNP